MTRESTTDKRGTAFNVILFIAASLANGIAIKLATRHGAQTPHILLLRGSICAALAAFFVWVSGESLTFKTPRLQVLRFMCAGIAILSVTASYQYLPTTSVALVSRMDLPLLIVLAPWFSLQAGRIQRLLAGACLLVLGGAIALTAHGNNDLRGYILAGCSTLTLVAGYFFLRASAIVETANLVALTPAAACVAFGALGCGLLPADTGLMFYDQTTILLMATSGVTMFLMYRFSTLLYQKLNMIDAQVPSIFVPALMLPIEATAFKQSFGTIYTTSVLTVVALMLTAQILRRNSYGRQ